MISFEKFNPKTNWDKFFNVQIEKGLPINNCTDDDNDLPELIAKVHDSMEGRYALTSEDEYNIHYFLCKLQ